MKVAVLAGTILLCVSTFRTVLAGQATTQDSTASIAGHIRSNKGRAVAGAEVVVLGTERRAVSDSLGRFALLGLPSGPAHLEVAAIGFEPVDTTFSLRRAQRLVMNVVLRVADWAAQVAQQESTQAAAGRVDSMARGLATTDTSTAFTYQRFGIRLLLAAVEHSSPDSSRVLSPLSAGQALALALGAARDSTALAIARALDLGGLGSDDLAARSRWFNEAARARRDMTLKVANALWVDTNANLQPNFARWAGTHYGAAVRALALHVPQVAAVMNRWADSVTNGAIHKIRDKPFGDSVEVVLTNAVYFKGRWLVPFDSSATQERPFTTAHGDRVSTPTMERRGNFAYRRGSGYQALRVPYMAGLTALYIVLPDSDRRAATVLEGLQRDGWPMPDPRSETREVQLRLPRLHVEQATELRPAFTALDLGILFDSARADFGGLAVPRPGQPSPCPPLSSGVHVDVCTRYRISEAAQHVYLDVDEQGTVAAAVTTVGMEIILSGSPQPIQFFVDRPFLFALRDEKTGTLLFVGLIAGPRQ